MNLKNLFLAVVLVNLFSAASYADFPYRVVSIECVGPNVSLDFNWDYSRSLFIPHIFLNDALETGGTVLTTINGAEYFEKEGKFSISLRPSDDQTEFKKSALIFGQYVELQCVQRDEWVANGCDSTLLDAFKSLRNMFKE